MNNICIKAENLSKSFFVHGKRQTVLRALKGLLEHKGLRKEFWVLRDLSFEIKKGEKVAIVGKNASGKTTLLRIITGIYSKTAGHIEVKGVPNALFVLRAGFIDELSVIDNIYVFGGLHGLRRDFLRGKEDVILKTSGLYHQRYSALKELSPGQQQRLALAIFFQCAGDFIIFDEVLLHLDIHFLKECEENYFNDLFSSEKTVIMASHDAPFLKKYCRTAIWLERGRIRMSGDAGKVIGEYERLSPGG